MGGGGLASGTWGERGVPWMRFDGRVAVCVNARVGLERTDLWHPMSLNHGRKAWLGVKS